MFPHFNVLVAVPAASPVPVTINQPQEMMNNMLVVSILPFLPPIFKKCCTVSLGKAGTATDVLSVQKKTTTYYVFSLHFLVPSDNRLQVDSTSYCVRFPVFNFGSSHGFLWLARNILSSMIDNTPMRIITLFFARCGRIERESSKVC